MIGVISIFQSFVNQPYWLDERRDSYGVPKFKTQYKRSPQRNKNVQVNCVVYVQEKSSQVMQGTRDEFYHLYD